MAKPYIDTYENQDGDFVLVYIAEASPCEPVEPQSVVISADHLAAVIDSLREALCNSDF